MQLHCIFGATSVGKTSRSILMARETGASVIVMDRYQCYSRLATGGGRPAEHEIQGMQRIYLDNRADFIDYSTPQAVQDLSRLLQEQTGDLIILEGGSMSLWQALPELVNQLSRFDQVTYDHLPLPPVAQYESLLNERIVQELLTPNQYRPTLLDEAESAWDDPHGRILLQIIIGFNVVHRLCVTHNVRPATLTSLYSLESISQSMIPDCIEYAQRQEHCFLNDVIPALKQFQ